MTQSNVIPVPDLREIDEAAALWVVRMDEDPSPQDIAEFRAWLRISDMHRDAFERLAGQWQNLDLLTLLNDLAESDDVQGSERDGWCRAMVLARPRLVTNVAMAASLALCVLLVSFTPWSDDTHTATHRTATGEQDTIDLPDGSRVVLNTSSILTVDYTPQTRRIRLLQGEAYFDVASNTGRPFVVETEKGSVTAVGTAFSVRVQRQQVGVFVTEGRVKLESPKSPAKTDLQQDALPETLTHVDVIAGQTALVAENSKTVESVSEEVIERELDWRDGILAFNGESLERVVADISRYTELAIEIEGDDLRQQPIGGYFKIGETEALFGALKLLANVEHDYIEDGRIKLYRAQ